MVTEKREVGNWFAEPVTYWVTTCLKDKVLLPSTYNEIWWGFDDRYGLVLTGVSLLVGAWSSELDMMEFYRFQQRAVQLYDVNHSRKAGDAYREHQMDLHNWQVNEQSVADFSRGLSG